VKPFYSGRIASKLMVRHTSLLTKNNAFEHKSMLTRENGKSDKMAAKYNYCSKINDLEGNIEQTAYNKVTVWNTTEVPRESAFPSVTRELRSRKSGSLGSKAARWVQRVNQTRPDMLSSVSGFSSCAFLEICHGEGHRVISLANININKTVYAIGYYRRTFISFTAKSCRLRY
jgi:hypothetical protein